jgi:hypothetical protein
LHESWPQNIARKKEGAGNAGCPSHPQRRVQKKHTNVVATGSPVSPSIPCAMVLTAYFALSPAIGLFCHRRKRNAQALSPLDASVEASGPHDFTVHVGAIRQARQSRPPHPTPNVRDDREPPLLKG